MLALNISEESGVILSKPHGKLSVSAASFLLASAQPLPPGTFPLPYHMIISTNPHSFVRRPKVGCVEKQVSIERESFFPILDVRIQIGSWRKDAAALETVIGYALSEST